MRIISPFLQLMSAFASEFQLHEDWGFVFQALVLELSHEHDPTRVGQQLVVFSLARS